MVGYAPERLRNSRMAKLWEKRFEKGDKGFILNIQEYYRIFRVFLFHKPLMRGYFVAIGCHTGTAPALHPCTGGHPEPVIGRRYSDDGGQIGR